VRTLRQPTDGSGYRFWRQRSGQHNGDEYRECPLNTPPAQHASHPLYQRGDPPSNVKPGAADTRRGSSGCGRKSVKYPRRRYSDARSASRRPSNATCATRSGEDAGFGGCVLRRGVVSHSANRPQTISTWARLKVHGGYLVTDQMIRQGNHYVDRSPSLASGITEVSASS
jgi:hypothetical protein